MRIAHFFDRVTLERGGTTRAMLDLCRVLAALDGGRRHTVRLVTADAADVPEAWRRGGGPALPEVVTLPGGRRPGGFLPSSSFAALGEVLAETDALHLHELWLPPTTQAAVRARAAGVPTVLSIHGMLDDWSMSQKRAKKLVYLRLYGRRMLGTAAVYHATADEEKRQASRWVDGSRVHVTPNVTDLEPFVELPGPGAACEAFGIARADERERPVVLFLSRLHYKKRPEAAIDAAAELSARGTPVDLLLAGSGEAAYVEGLKRRASAAGLGGSCRFVGMVTGDLKLSLYQAADVFCLPTSQENFGLVYTESLACGTPVVATRGTDIWRELEAGGGAEIAEPEPAAVADAIARVAFDPARRDEMGRAGREHVFRWLAPSGIVAAFERMYEAAAAAGARP